MDRMQASQDEHHSDDAERLEALGYSSKFERSMTLWENFSLGLPIYISFQMIVAGALYARFVRWKPSGPFRIGRFATLINVAALIYGVCAIADILWPQSPAAPWYVNYAIPFTTVVVIATGTLYMVVGRPYERDTTHGASVSTIRIP